MVKKGFLKRTGCILISASIILAGWTFAGSSVSEAELETETIEATVETPAEDSNITLSEDTTEESEAQTETSDNAGQQDAVAEETVEVPATMMLRSVSPSLLTTSLAATSSTDSEDEEYSGTTLVKVPASASSYTVKAGTTAIATNALKGSNVSTLTFAAGNSITSIGDQGGWPADGTEIYCPGCTKNSYVVKYITENFYDRNIYVYFYDEPVVTEYTITIEYQLISTTGDITT